MWHTCSNCSMILMWSITSLYQTIFRSNTQMAHCCTTCWGFAVKLACLLADSSPVSILRMSVYVSAGLPGFLLPCLGVHRTILDTGLCYCSKGQQNAPFSVWFLLIALGRFPYRTLFSHMLTPVLYTVHTHFKTRNDGRCHPACTLGISNNLLLPLSDRPNKSEIHSGDFFFFFFFFKLCMEWLVSNLDRYII